MTIKTLSEANAAPCWNLRLDALRTEPLAFGEAFEEHQATTVETLAMRIRNMSSGSFILGAFDEETLVGMARFVREEHIKERHKGNIYGVYVRGSHRGKNIGWALLSELLRIAGEDSSLEQISLAVATSQLAAIHLYTSLGFEIFGTESHALKVDGQYVDEHHMVLRLR